MRRELSWLYSRFYGTNVAVRVAMRRRPRHPGCRNDSHLQLLPIHAPGVARTAILLGRRRLWALLRWFYMFSRCIPRGQHVCIDALPPAACSSTGMSVQVPQIVHDVIRGHKRALSWRFVVGMSVTRMVLPLYALACPYTIFNGEVLRICRLLPLLNLHVFPFFPSSPNRSVATLMVLLQAAQLAVMCVQARFGPRAFVVGDLIDLGVEAFPGRVANQVPWMCLPHVYNYYRTVPPLEDEELGSPECVCGSKEARCHSGSGYLHERNRRGRNGKRRASGGDSV